MILVTVLVPRILAWGNIRALNWKAFNKTRIPSHNENRAALLKHKEQTTLALFIWPTSDPLVAGFCVWLSVTGLKKWYRGGGGSSRIVFVKEIKLAFSPKERFSISGNLAINDNSNIVCPHKWCPTQLFAILGCLTSDYHRGGTMECEPHFFKEVCVN